MKDIYINRGPPKRRGATVVMVALLVIFAAAFGVLWLSAPQ